MENIKEEFENLFNQSKEYLDTRLELVKLQSVDKLSDVVSSAVSRLVVVVVAVMFVILISIAFSLWIGQLLGESYYGFFIISGFYALIGLICSIFRQQLFKKPIVSLMIKKMLNP